MVGSLGSFFEVLDFSFQIFEMAFFALTEGSLSSPILCLTLLLER